MAGVEAVASLAFQRTGRNMSETIVGSGGMTAVGA
jgi:hypothetical protein